MAQNIEPRLLKGFRDTLPDQMAVRQQLIQTISQVVQGYGFQPLETPALEYADILQGKLGDEGEKLLYQFTDHGDRQVAMRYDFTVPLARVMAQYPDLAKPFKRYQVGPVWRADNTQRGRYREFYQFDIDTVGSDSPLADAEILVAMQEVLSALGIKDFTIRINHRQFITDVTSHLGIEDQAKIVYAGLDKWDKIGGAEGVLAYWQEQGLPHSQSLQLINQIKDGAASHHPANHIIQLAQDMGLQADHFTIDPTIVRGLDYYTGLVFETTLTNAPEFGSVFSGGRYDGLIGRFAKQPIPAVGTSVGLDRLISALDSLQLLPKVSLASDVLVTIFSEELQDQSLEAVGKLRQAGIKAELSYQVGDLGKQLKNAVQRGISWAIIIGPDEAEAQQVTLRNLQDSQEQKLSLDQAIQKLSQ